MLLQNVPPLVDSPMPLLWENGLPYMLVLILVAETLNLGWPVFTDLDCKFLDSVVSIKLRVKVIALLQLIDIDFKLSVLWV